MLNETHRSLLQVECGTAKGFNFKIVTFFSVFFVCLVVCLFLDILGSYKVSSSTVLFILLGILGTNVHPHTITHIAE